MAANRLKSLDFEDINKSFYEQFKIFCYGPGENKEISTFAGFIKDIKSVMNEAKEDGLQTADGILTLPGILSPVWLLIKLKIQWLQWSY